MPSQHFTGFEFLRTHCALDYFVVLLPMIFHFSIATGKKEATLVSAGNRLHVVQSIRDNGYVLLYFRFYIEIRFHYFSFSLFLQFVISFPLTFATIFRFRFGHFQKYFERIIKVPETQAHCEHKKFTKQFNINKKKNHFLAPQKSAYKMHTNRFFFLMRKTR